MHWAPRAKSCCNPMGCCSCSSVHERMAGVRYHGDEATNQLMGDWGSLLKAAEVTCEHPAAPHPSGFQLDLSLVHLQSVIVPKQLSLWDRAVLLLLCFLHRALGSVFRGVLRVLGSLRE